MPLSTRTGRPIVRVVLALGLAGVVGADCSAPTSPCDPRASTGFNSLLLSCTAAGSDAQCKATAENGDLYVCGPRSADVTTLATYVSSDPSVASFGALGRPPGYLMTVGTGEVTVTAQYQGLALLGAVHLFLTVGSPPESLAALAVTVRDLATSAGVKGANVVVTPDDGSPQTCVTGLLGSCGVYVRHGSMVIAATAPGYQPGQMAFAIGPTSISVTATLSLSPSGS